MVAVVAQDDIARAHWDEARSSLSLDDVLALVGKCFVSIRAVGGGIQQGEVADLIP
mgnify:CR=1 FL=1